MNPDLNGNIRGRGIAPIVVASSATAIGILPVFILGGMFVLMGPELGFGERELGIAVGGFYGVSALISPYAGVIGDRLGPRRSLRIGFSISVVVALGIAVSPTFLWLFLFLLLGGLATALNQMGGNVLLVAATPRHRQGVAFAVKQSAVPFASLASGAMLPLVGLTVGWRWAFVVPVVLVVVLLIRLPDQVTARRQVSTEPVDLLAMMLLAAGAAAGSAAANAAPAFLVPFAVSVGVETASAGMLLAFGGGVGVAARLTAGWAGDRFELDGLLVSSVLVASGMVGYLLLVLNPVGPVLVLAVVIVFGAGWGWSGIFTHAVARSYPAAAGRATGISQSGVFAGGMLGPVVFGFVVSATDYRTAWFVTLAFAVVGGTLMTFGRRRLRRGERLT